jgi:hypothetical protein
MNIFQLGEGGGFGFICGWQQKKENEKSKAKYK